MAKTPQRRVLTTVPTILMMATTGAAAIIPRVLLLLLILVDSAYHAAGGAVIVCDVWDVCHTCECRRVRVYDPCAPPTRAVGSWGDWGGCSIKRECGGKGVSISIFIKDVPEGGCRGDIEPVPVVTWQRGAALPTGDGSTIERRKLMAQLTARQVVYWHEDAG